jgi:hypothetical protein
MNKENELLEATEKLLGILSTIDAITFGDLTISEWKVIEEAQQIVEKHRPKPQRIEGWINLYHDSKPGGSIWPTEQEAKQNCGINGVRQVHIREVVPVEWQSWTVEMVRNHKNFQETVDAHNAEMERVIAKIGE